MKKNEMIKYAQQIGIIGLGVFILIGCEATQLESKQRTVDFLTNSEGKSVYIFDKDEPNKSNCDTDCQKRWTKVEGIMTHSPDIKLIEGTEQLAYRKHPLYTFNKDEVPGDVKGDNFRTTWHLVYATNTIDDTQVAFSEKSMKQTYLTDKDGRALYTFDTDKLGESSCHKGCENIWPVYYAPILLSVPSPLDKKDFATIDRNQTKAFSGAFKQTTYKGKPLYYYYKDLDKVGSTKGDWVGGVWDLIEINAHKSSEKANPRPPLPKKVSDVGLSEEAQKGRKLFYNASFGSCFKCHGVDGQSMPPSIAGIPINNVIARFGDKNVIKKRLLDMKNNSNSGRDASMIAGAQALSDEQIEQVSLFIATLKK